MVPRRRWRRHSQLHGFPVHDIACMQNVLVVLVPYAMSPTYTSCSSGGDGIKISQC